MARDLDGQVEAFRTRPMDAGRYTFLAVDALVLKVREAGRAVNVHALLAVGYLGLDILAKSRLTKITTDNPTDQEVTITAITA